MKDNKKESKPKATPEYVDPSNYNMLGTLIKKK